MDGGIRWVWFVFGGRSSVKAELADYQTHKLSFYSKEVQLIGCHYVKQR